MDKTKIKEETMKFKEEVYPAVGKLEVDEIGLSRYFARIIPGHDNSYR